MGEEGEAEGRHGEGALHDFVMGEHPADEEDEDRAGGGHREWWRTDDEDHVLGGLVLLGPVRIPCAALMK